MTAAAGQTKNNMDRNMLSSEGSNEHIKYEETVLNSTKMTLN